MDINCNLIQEPGIDELKRMFPETPEQELVTAMLKTDSIEEAVNVLLEPTTGVYIKHKPYINILRIW